jgi:hypothetical protein
LKANWGPVVVRNDDGAPAGNRGLLERGAVPMTSIELTGITDLRDWTKALGARPTKQPDLFGFPEPSES